MSVCFSWVFQETPRRALENKTLRVAGGVIPEEKWVVNKSGNTRNKCISLLCVQRLLEGCQGVARTYLRPSKKYRIGSQEVLSGRARFVDHKAFNQKWKPNITIDSLSPWSSLWQGTEEREREPKSLSRIKEINLAVGQPQLMWIFYDEAL